MWNHVMKMLFLYKLHLNNLDPSSELKANESEQDSNHAQRQLGPLKQLTIWLIQRASVVKLPTK